DDSLAQAVPESFAVFALPDRRRAFEPCIAVGDLLRAEGEVMWAGLDGEGKARYPGGPHGGNGVRRRKVNDMRRAAVLAAKRDHERDGVMLPGTRTRGKIVLIACWIPRWRRG